MEQHERISPDITWEDIDTVLLDMDGTLLDKHFDDYFWEQYLPEHYSLENNLSIEEAKDELFARYRSVENTLSWADADFWSAELGLDIPGLKLRINHLIGVHPYVIEFLEFCLKMRKKLYLVTNAHSSTLSIKLEKTAIAPWFDKIICAEEIGYAKEELLFWGTLENKLGFDRERTLLVDDTEKVLFTAEKYGLKHLLFVAKPSSRKEILYSSQYPSIVYFKEILA